jgi:transcriptional regulator with XRE-family HTH domain
VPADTAEIRPEDIGARVRAVRELAGLSPRDVGQAAGLSGREVAAVERGSRPVSVDELRAIAAALHVSAKVLVAAAPAPAQGQQPALTPADPGADRRRDFNTRKWVEDSWSDLRAEMEDVIRQCMRVSTVGSGDDVPALLDGLERELRRLRINADFQRELIRHERTVAQARGKSGLRLA